MTIGTIVIIILGVAYVVWSYYIAKNFKKCDNVSNTVFGIWASVTISGLVVLMLLILLWFLPYLFANWNTKLW
jgi:hypothetical protein